MNSYSSFQAAVLELRSPDGHNPTKVWKYPVQWSNIDAVLSTSGTGVNAIDGNANAIASTLLKSHFVPVAVTQITCGSFTFSTMNQTLPAYWGERWELFKQRYAESRWMWLRGIREVEFWNEPDLSSNTCMDLSTTWLDMYTLSSTAIQNAYNDFNTDVANQQISCPLYNSVCPFTPYVIVSAFAKTSFSSTGSFGQTTVTNEHLLFPPFMKNFSSSWYNLHAYSYHSYDKSGASQGTDSATITTALGTTHDSVHAPPLPVHVTEHASHTASNFAPLNVTTDDVLQASRLASQILYQAMYGIGSMLFKMTMTPDGTTGTAVKKNGIMFADNTNYPFRVGDTTASAEAARIVIRRIQGSRPLLACTFKSNNIGSSDYRTCLTVVSSNQYDILLVNDASDSKTASTADKPYTFDLSMNLGPLSVPSGAVVMVIEFSRDSSTVSHTYHGEISDIISLDASLNVSHYVPIGAVMSFSITRSPQVAVALPTVDDTYVAAGRWFSSSAFSTSSVLKVGTSATFNHSSTNVAALQFNIPSNYKNANFIVLELVVASMTGHNESISSVVGTSRASSWSAGSLSWKSASYALRTPVNVSYVNKVSYDFVDFGSVDMLGHVTVNPSDAVGTTKRIDVTEFVKSATYTNIEIFIARRVRNNVFRKSSTSSADFPADDLNGGQSVSFYSSRYSDVTRRPQLRFYFDKAAPTISPSVKPFVSPSVGPSIMPIVTPSITPSVTPSIMPTVTPSVIPSVTPSITPIVSSSTVPSTAPLSSGKPVSRQPTSSPSFLPTFAPTNVPLSLTVLPTKSPVSVAPVSISIAPYSSIPSGRPTSKPTTPTVKPSVAPTNKPTVKPSATPTVKPSVTPTNKPTIKPTITPTVKPI